MLDTTHIILKKAQITGILERICQALELTQTQFETAKSRYEAVGNWLAESDDALLSTAKIYPQGSISLGTTVKPLDREEYDLDLVCLVPVQIPNIPPSYLKKLIGDRLRANGRYKDIVEEKPRCWRLNYANEFHLDITPSIPNPACLLGGELVPDKKLREWKPSNPKGYRQWFEDHAKLQPRLALLKAEFAEAQAQVEALPEPSRFKGILRRCVQLCKRHRDVWFSKGNGDLAPISIIITTLAAKSYAYCVENFTYDTELDVLLDVVRHMPLFVETKASGGREYYFIWNETTQGENFAEKWNRDQRLAKAFFLWQSQALSDLECLASLAGLDNVRKSLSLSFGESVVTKAMASATAAVTAARTSGLLSITPGVGLGVATARGVTVRSNTFFGA